MWEGREGEGEEGGGREKNEGGRKGRKDREGEQVENSLMLYFCILFINLHGKDPHEVSQCC